MTDKRETLRYRTLLKDELAEVEKRLQQTNHFVPAPALRALNALITNGGKRLRPALLLLSAHLFDVYGEHALSLAAAIELLHTATLIHDDLIDNASVRRNAPTLNAIWTPTVAVLTGDLVFAWAARLATDGGDTQIIRRFTETLEIVCSGEIRQSFKDKQTLPSKEDYFERIYAKTASLFALATETGARLSEGANEEITAMWRFGKTLGLAFQIADDLLDITSAEEALGKPAGNDLRHGIITLPVLIYLEMQPAARPRLQSLLQEPDTTGFDQLIADVRQSDAIDETLQIAETHVQDALEILAAYPASPYRAAMEEITRFAVRRRY